MNKSSDGNISQLAEIMTFLNRAKAESKDWHAGIKRRRALYNGEHYTGRAKPGEERFVDPTYGNAVDLGVGILLGHELEWNVTGWSPSSKEEKDSSHIEKYLAAVLSVNSEREEMYIPYEVLMHFLRDGCAVLYAVWDRTIHETSQTTVQFIDEETGVPQNLPAFSDIPVRTQVIDPLDIFIRSGGQKRWAQVFRVEKMTVFDAEERFGITVEKYKHLRRTDKMQQTDDLIDMWEYATKEVVDPITNEVIERIPGAIVRNATIFAGTIVKPLSQMPGYDDIPFSIAFFKPIERKSSKNWTQSIIDPLEGTISLLERSVNRRMHQINQYTSIPLTFKTARTGVLIDTGIGNVQTIGPDEDLSYPQWRGNPPDVREHIEFLRARAQQSGFSDVMFGSGASAISGYALSQLGDQNRIRLTQPIVHLQMMWSAWAKKVLKLTSNFASGMVIRIYGRFKGQDFAEQMFEPDLANYNVRAVVKPEFPNERVRNHAMATQVRGMLSDNRIMQVYLDVDQPDDERKRRIQEMAETHPIVLQYTLMKELTDRAEQGDVTAIASLKMIMSQQAQPQGAPGQPQSNPEQLLGTASPNGNMTPQQRGGMPPGAGFGEQFGQDISATPSAVTGELE